MSMLMSLAEHAPVMLWSAGPDGLCDHVNAAWRGFTGRGLADELGDGWQENLHPDDRRRCIARYQQHLARHEPFELECRMRRHDGVYRPVLFRAAPRPSPAGGFAGYAGSCTEITVRPADSGPDPSEMFERLIDHLCVAGFDGYWTWLTPSWTRTLGWTAEELMSRPLVEFAHPDDREAIVAARAGLKQGEPHLAMTNRYLCRDGTYRWFEWRSVSDADKQRVYAVARDVTQEQDSRRIQRELTASLAATLNSLADGLITTNRDAVVTQLNPVAERMTGWTSTEAIGRSLAEVFEIVQADTHEPADLLVDRTLQQGIASQSTEHTLLVARDRTERPIAFSRAPMRDQAGTLIGAVILFRDMTAEWQARRDQEQLQRRLMFADRMASVGTLAAGVAHEINNPLAYVMANLDMILEELRGSEVPGALHARIADWIEMASDARHGADRIRKIVRGLKTFSRSDEESRATIEVIPALDLAIELAFNEIKHRARLVRNYGPTPPVEADESRLGQVFVNLLVNAAQAVSEDGAEHNEIRIETSTDAAGRAVVDISDTGPGIPPEALGRIFDPFFTTKPVGVGTGLGLSICHTIITSLGGDISAHNRDHGGACFRITLPPSPEPLNGTDADARPHPPVTERRARVLVVDDEPTVGVALARVLRAHTVIAVTSAREALDLLANGARFDLVLSDVMMPDMSGMELYEELGRLNPALARTMVFITGGAFTASAGAFLERVPNQRLEKPFDPSAVRQLVEQLTR